MVQLDSSMSATNVGKDGKTGRVSLILNSDGLRHQISPFYTSFPWWGY